MPDPTENTQLEATNTYTLYWFDKWPIEDGAIAEHWDAAPKEPRSTRDAST